MHEKLTFGHFDVISQEKSNTVTLVVSINETKITINFLHKSSGKATNDSDLAKQNTLEFIAPNGTKLIFTDPEKPYFHDESAENANERELLTQLARSILPLLKANWVKLLNNPEKTDILFTILGMPSS